MAQNDILVNAPIFIVVVLITGYIEFWLPYAPRFFREQDPDLSYPKVPSTFSTNSVLAICFVGVLLVLVLVRQLGLLGERVSLTTLNWAFGTGMLVQAFCINLLKLVFGRLRPNFFALCNYKGFADIDWSNVPSEAYTAYMENTTAGMPGDFASCLKDNHAKGHHSFPSGAGGWAFCGLGFLGMVLAAAVKRKDLPYSLQVSAFVLPLILAGWISCTRVVEFAHREEDIAVAAIIGFAFACWSFNTLPPLDGKEDVLTEPLEMAA